MKAFKTVILVAALAIVGYGVYTALVKPNKKKTGDGGPAPLYRAELDGKDSPDMGLSALSESWNDPSPKTLSESDPHVAHKATSGEDFQGASAQVNDHAAAPGERTLGSVSPVSATELQTQQHVEARFSQDLLGIKELLSQGDLGKSQMLLSGWYARRNELSEPSRAKLQRLLDDLTGTVLYSTDFHLMPPHKVQGSETPEQIAARYAVPWRLLAKINGVSDGSTLPVGTELKVVPGPLHAEVDITNYQMTLYLVDGRYAGRFKFGIGHEVPVQEGRFTVTQKIEKPPYRDANGTTFEPGAPQNPLGNLLIEVGGKFAIHGTADDATVGKGNPEGCIRLAGRDIDDLYDMLVDGKSNVTIRR